MTEYGLSHGQYLKARRIRAHKPGTSIKYIAHHVGATERQVRDALDLQAERRLANAPRAKKAQRPKPAEKASTYQKCGHRKEAGIPETPRMVVPHDVLAEREQRLSLSPQSLTAALLGDPPPGHRQYLDNLAAAARRRA